VKATIVLSPKPQRGVMWVFSRARLCFLAHSHTPTLRPAGLGLSMRASLHYKHSAPSGAWAAFSGRCLDTHRCVYGAERTSAPQKLRHTLGVWRQSPAGVTIVTWAETTSSRNSRITLVHPESQRVASQFYFHISFFRIDPSPGHQDGLHFFCLHVGSKQKARLQPATMNFCPRPMSKVQM